MRELFGWTPETMRASKRRCGTLWLNRAAVAFAAVLLGGAYAGAQNAPPRSETQGTGTPAGKAERRASHEGNFPATTSEGWKIVRDAKRKCQVTVPPDWTLVGSSGLANNRAKKGHAGIHANVTSSWQELTQMAKATMRPGSVIEDTEKRLLFKHRPTGLHYFVARSFPGFACVGEVDYDDADAGPKYDDIARQIINSVDRIPEQPAQPKSSTPTQGSAPK